MILSFMTNVPVRGGVVVVVSINSSGTSRNERHRYDLLPTFNFVKPTLDDLPACAMALGRNGVRPPDTSRYPHWQHTRDPGARGGTRIILFAGATFSVAYFLPTSNPATHHVAVFDAIALEFSWFSRHVLMPGESVEYLPAAICNGEQLAMDSGGHGLVTAGRRRHICLI